MTTVLVRDREATHRKEGHVKVEAETGSLLPKAKGHLELPEAGRGRQDSPLEALGGGRPCPCLHFTLPAPLTGRESSLLFKATQSVVICTGGHRA